MSKKLICVNLGCGPSGIEGWINYDWGMLPLMAKTQPILKLLVSLGVLSDRYLVKWPKFRLVDIRKRLPLSDKSVDYIYCSHVLEHLEKWEAESILKECRRVLKKKGVLRVVLPDLEKVISRYRPGKADEFCREFYGFDKDKKYLFSMFIRGHEWMYDKQSFLELLKNAGFENVEVSDRLKSKLPDVDKLDLPVHEELSVYYEIKG
jgi:predicted SAM-dependent methyltransferase